MRKLIALALSGAVLLTVGGLAQAAPKSVTLFEDASGDADLGQGLGASIPGGFDLTEGSISKVGKNLEFTVTHADMPPFGSMPEATRFLWSFTVDGTNYRLTVKSADIGKPDVAAGQTTDRVGRVDAAGHFRLEGACKTDSTLPLAFVNCPPLEYLEGAFDPAAKSFTVIVPLASVKAKTRSLIGPGSADLTGCQICWVSHYAERSLSTSVIDSAGQTVTYKVPKK